MSLARLPHRFDASTLPEVLAAIDLPMPAGSHLLHAAGVPLASTGFRRTEAQVDEALDKTKLSMADRIAVKIAMSQHLLLMGK